IQKRPIRALLSPFQPSGEARKLFGTSFYFVARLQVLRRICRWWELDPYDWNTFQECGRADVLHFDDPELETTLPKVRLTISIEIHWKKSVKSQKQHKI
nr:hypothetical protein [Tanacetum cinerariifolium]